MKTKKERDLTHYPTNPTKNKVGLRARGIRRGSKYDEMAGTIIEAYYTINKGYASWPRNNWDGWHNYAYKLLCDDGKVRSYQAVRLIEKEVV